MGMLSGNPKNEPLHYGEVFGLWSYLNITKGTVAGYQTVLHHAGDEDLKNLLKEAIDQGKQEENQIETLLKENGVGLPPTPPERPDARSENIPAGARFLDPEIGAMLSADTAAGLVSCSKMIGQAVREDIAMMFGQFHTQKAAIGAKVLRLNKEKGWLVPPPLHQKPDNC
ncbi:uncharacterized protein DUF3231 [Melghiribacillus thermohalophilus]|uniref:Uncharacterized protein DUF3231 n=1 Tax=Melghiribacillus thermohalophilus TaxID=1324956 RepID=A0A4R3MQ47_9BACI|nr:DUF3231 family protein [Melghiribacillus thermohalophilus]TCT15986.1 uncharacterized protein DUF3231 [Melghiribacillus thermohalophilus]